MSLHVGIYHCFARSGGTLVNRLLGASQDVLVLSEVGPAASARDPVDQAVDWLGLAGPDDADRLRTLPFGALVADLASRATTQGKHLVVRDFPTPNFLMGAFGATPPTGRLECVDALADAGIATSRLVVARRAAAAYRSIRRSFSHLRSLGVDHFAVAYHGYAQAVADLPVVRYEDLTAAPDVVVPRLCQLLEVPFDAGALVGFADFQACTGDIGLAEPSRGSDLRHVQRLDDSTDDPSFVAAAAHPLCRAADEILGFEPIGPPAPPSAAVVALVSVLADTRALLRQSLAVESRARAAEEAMGRLASDVASSIARADILAGALADSHRQITALEDEVLRLRRSWDQTTGELARAEAIAEERRRQVERLLEQLI